MSGSGFTEQASPEGFAARVRIALAWRWGSQLIAQLITWSATIMVVRLLNPADYGLFAMSQVVVVALNFLNGWSFATSLVQAERVGRREIGQVFALLLLMNGTLAAAQLLLAPVAADYYGQPAVAHLLRVQALIFITTPFIALPASLLSRRLEFRSQGIANLASAIVGAMAALTLAWLGYGVWALVYAPILAFATRGLIMTVAARLFVWPVFNFRGAGQLIGFGGALTLCQLFWIIQSQSDIFIAGSRFTPSELGLYSEALFLTLIVTGRFLPPINEVAFPAYAELHKAGHSMAPFFERTVRSVLLVTAPIYIGLALTAPEAIITLFGDKWAAMAPIVTGLCLVMPLLALQIICSPTTNATGHTRTYILTSATGAVLFTACFLAGVQFGPMGLVHAWWVAAPLLLLVTLVLTLPHVGMSAARYLAACAPAVISCAIMALAVIAVRTALPDWHPALRLIALTGTGVMAYSLALIILWRDVVRDSWTLLRRTPASPIDLPANESV
ncbi:lipopolysaccharide biosynthesis protein [Qipengyuania marisflavi]|uniref:Lipopolysaccharide biosynthesis protein n=1 Tax=Qipengyuania marisflavi TaxID=2486356 RepID=A0A5S3NY70_9SPHN|nr:lipopolysaccharide biosynthesis protein [Qipengyuania marisflavi]TMM45321.1 lipopolysaccharide biosynthesis protein [Qipengyuania marisflavi]